MTEHLSISTEDAKDYTEALTMVLSGAHYFATLGADSLGIPEALGLSRDEWGRRVIGGGKVWRTRDERRQLSVHLTTPQHEGGAGLSQRQAAEALGVDKNTVKNDVHSESGENSPPEQDQGAKPQVNDTPYPESGENSPPESTTSLLPESGDADVEESTSESDTSGSSDTEPSLPPPASSPVNDGDEWYTPPWLFRALGIEFSLDVCAPLDQTYSAVPADKHLTIEDDGLAQHWHGTVWCNPPYSKPEPWARRLIHHGDGLLLTHIPMNAGWAVDVWESCDAIRLFQAMEFVRPDGTSQRPGYWLQLAAFGPVATEALGRIQPLGDAAFNKRRVASPMWKRVVL